MRRRDNPHGYWYWAKRYGYGWGAPASWQGLLLLSSVGVAVMITALLPLRLAWVGIVLLLFSLAANVWGGYRHGEPARWRWGNGG